MAMSTLNLPIDVPWTLISASPDMMDTQFCNKQFPFAWRSSLAISAFEPNLADLPEQLCDQRITLLKITSSVTGYQPTKAETDSGYASFPTVPTEELNRIFSEYFACYGVLVNAAVFPSRNTIRSGEVTRTSITFAGRRPGTELDNPYEESGARLRATGEPKNRLTGLFAAVTGGKGEFDLHHEVVVEVPLSTRIDVEIIHAARAVTMEAYLGNSLVHTVSSPAEQNRVHVLTVADKDVDRIVLRAPANEASMLGLTYYQPVERPVELGDYPHIVDFEPKMRDFYQAATDTGEVLTASVSEAKTGKSMTHTETTQTGLALGAKYGIKGKDPQSGTETSGELSGQLSHTWGETDQDTRTLVSDSSRDRRERNGTTTYLSQLYNLLTGYHAGTNRATFLMLPRPQTMQPTDHRTFVQGLRTIEGVQDYFLVVVRPKAMKGICVEVLLDTGHFPEKVDIATPKEEYDESSEFFHVTGYAKGGGGAFGQGAETKALEGFPSAAHTVAAGWVVDRTKGDPGHPGIAEGADGSNQQALSTLRAYNYQASSDSTVQISGEISGANWWGPGAVFERDYTVFTRSEQPRDSSTAPVVTSKFLVTSRGLCACFESGEKCLRTVASSKHPEFTEGPGVLRASSAGPAPTDRLEFAGSAEAVTGTSPTPQETTAIAEHSGESVVFEGVIEIDAALLTRSATAQTRTPAMREMIRRVHSVMATNWRLPSRRPPGTVGFLSSDYFSDRVRAILPAETLDMPIARLGELLDINVMALGRERTVGDVLATNLDVLARQARVGVSDVAELRRELLTRTGQRLGGDPRLGTVEAHRRQGERE